jgi:hypothetical protein
MGCDIHCFVEYRSAEDHKELQNYWFAWGDRINPGRDYKIFALLAGVRGRIGDAGPKPKGLPENLGWYSKDYYWMQIVETEEECGSDDATRAQAESWVKSGCSTIRKTEHGSEYVSNPDMHSCSWATYEELVAAVDQHASVGWHALVAAVKAIHDKGCDVRVVYFFDN